VAPVHGAVLTVDNGPHGGNLDAQEITTGNVVSLRINREGAYLFLGDCHAIQGDGECNGMGAIEIAATLTVKVSLQKAPARLNHPRIETSTHICTLG
jgi:acetamidase/formamidase